MAMLRSRGGGPGGAGSIRQRRGSGMGARRSAACYGGGDPAVERVEERMVGAVPGSQAANQAAPEAPLETVDAPKPARAPGKLGLQILDFGVGDPPQIVLSAALSPGPAHRLPLPEA